MPSYLKSRLLPLSFLSFSCFNVFSHINLFKAINICNNRLLIKIVLWTEALDGISIVYDTDEMFLMQVLQTFSREIVIRCLACRFLLKDIMKCLRSGTAEGEGLVGPPPHHFFAPLPPLFALKKIIKIKKVLKQVFFRLYSAILSVFSLISNARHFVGLLCFSR